VRVRWAGVNGGCETFRVRGEHWFAANRRAGDGGFPLGAEGAGEVVQLGDAATLLDQAGVPLRLGDAVTFVGGAFAEFVLVQAAALWRVPAATAEVTAATISGLTAYAALHATARVRAGEVVLVTAAAGGTGHWAVQAAASAGAHVVAVAGGRAKAALCARLGAHRVVDHEREPLAAVLAREYANRLDVVYDGVGGAVLQDALAHLAPRGRALVVGYISGYPHNGAHAAPCALSEGLFWRGGTLEVGQGRRLIGGVWPGREAVLVAKRRLFDDLQAGRIEAAIDDTATFCGLDAVADAVDHMLSRRSIGKVCVRIHNESCQ